MLVWIQTVCKCYQQTAKVAASKEREHDDIFYRKRYAPHSSTNVIKAKPMLSNFAFFLWCLVCGDTRGISLCS